jgi:hypothetical protein
MNFNGKTGFVMLSEAKHLCAHRARPFASLRVTSQGSGDWAVFPVLVVKTHYRARRLGEESQARPLPPQRHKCRGYAP